MSLGLRWPRGRLTPSWWEEKDSQFGVLKRWLRHCAAGRLSMGSACRTSIWMGWGDARANQSSSGSAFPGRRRTLVDSTCSAAGSGTIRRTWGFDSNTTAARPESQRTACCEVVSAGSQMPSFGSVTGSGPRLGGPRSAAGRLRAEDDLAPALERRAAGGTPRRRGRSAARTAATISRYIPIPVPGLTLSPMVGSSWPMTLRNT